ncbi:protein disulfide isomerase [Plasmodium sp. gorilla clade G2]|uniref:protein disulfide isomerase n=1 Tax=Plasmodium sp. gorilla clade G2 TaxID=880535 RepID=UPI000D210EA4|nr:protein disulfide isomerase [Plasmodium sp. gorilla clade G2]SOV13825.1 protein disulfide isomerase [Plasmodium sp. gorilla clade G2]
MNRKYFSSLFLFLISFVFQSFVRSHGDLFNEFVTDIHDGELDKFTTKNDIVLVMFYAPWCGHCKRLIPEYNEAANILNEKKSEIKLASIDATVENALAQEYGITGYPTLILFNKKNKINYGGGRTANSIVEWLLQMTGPVFSNIEGNIEDVLKEKKINVAFYLEYTSEDNDLYKKFNEVGDKNREIAKYFVKKNDKHNKLFCYRTDENKVEYDEKMPLEEFVTSESFPLFGEINTENYRFYAESPKELVWVCATTEQYNEIKEHVRLAAQELRKKTHFVLLNIPEYAEHAKASLGLTEFPGLAFQSNEGRYLLKNPKESLLNHNAIINFFKDVEAGKIEKSLKSEPIPEDDKNAPVKIVVGNSFVDVVLKSGKDVLIEIYAPWCGHCKKLEPVYEDLGRKLKKYDSIIVAKMDGTLNETPIKDFEWSGFPTIFFVKAGSKIPLPYEGERSLKGFVDFLNKHATNTPISIDGVPEFDDGTSEEL